LFGEPSRTQWDLNFTVLGIPVRVHPMFWVVSVLLGMGGGTAKPVNVLMWVVAVFISILVHEMGHAVVIRANGWQPWITLHGFGGLASYEPTRTTPWTQIGISLAGPAAGFALAAVILAILTLAGNDWFVAGMDVVPGPMENLQLWRFTFDMLFINILWGLVNLLPIYPLDGGQISRQLFNRYAGNDGLRQSLWLSILAAAGVALYAGSRHELYIALMFGYMAYNSYTILQAYFGGGGFGGGWR
jgi:Zn-dependent protease